MVFARLRRGSEVSIMRPTYKVLPRQDGANQFKKYGDSD